MRKMVYITVVIVLIIFSYVFAVKMHWIHYESRYFEKLGVDRVRYMYSDMLRDFGEPIEVIKIEEHKSIEVVYSEFTMYFNSSSSDSFLLGINITGEKYRFGWRSIGVGSTKKDVEAAYKNVLKSPDTDNAYVDGKIFVEFYFDENDIVSKISFFDYSHF